MVRTGLSTLTGAQASTEEEEEVLQCTAVYYKKHVVYYIKFAIANYRVFLYRKT